MADTTKARPSRMDRRKTGWIIFAVASLLTVVAIAFFADMAIKTIVVRRAAPNLTDVRSDATKRGIESALAFADAGDIDSAYSVVDTTVAAGPISNADASALYQTKANIAVNAGNKDVAVDAQGKAIAREPTSWKLVQGMSDIYASFDDTANADAYAAKADKVRAANQSTPEEDLN